MSILHHTIMSVEIMIHVTLLCCALMNINYSFFYLKKKKKIIFYIENNKIIIIITLI